LTHVAILCILGIAVTGLTLGVFVVGGRAIDLPFQVGQLPITESRVMEFVGPVWSIERVPIGDVTVKHVFNLKSLQWQSGTRSEDLDNPLLFGGEKFLRWQDVRIIGRNILQFVLRTIKLLVLSDGFNDSRWSPSVIRQGDPVDSVIFRKVNADKNPSPLRENYALGAPFRKFGLSPDSEERQKGNNHIDGGNPTYDIFAMRHKWLNFCLGCGCMILACCCFSRAARMYFDNRGLAFIGWIIVGFPLWIVGMGAALRTY